MATDRLTVSTAIVQICHIAETFSNTALELSISFRVAISVVPVEQDPDKI